MSKPTFLNQLYFYTNKDDIIDNYRAGQPSGRTISRCYWFVVLYLSGKTHDASAQKWGTSNWSGWLIRHGVSENLSVCLLNCDVTRIKLAWKHLYELGTLRDYFSLLPFSGPEGIPFSTSDTYKEERNLVNKESRKSKPKIQLVRGSYTRPQVYLSTPRWSLLRNG